MVLLVAVKTAVTSGGPALGMMAEAGVHAAQKKRANLCMSALGLRRDPAMHGAARRIVEGDQSRIIIG
jgi:hypothetical protein